MYKNRPSVSNMQMLMSLTNEKEFQDSLKDFLDTWTFHKNLKYICIVGEKKKSGHASGHAPSSI